MLTVAAMDRFVKLFFVLLLPIARILSHEIISSGTQSENKHARRNGKSTSVTVTSEVEICGMPAGDL